MTPTIKLPIDDELLAAYLDGRLEGEQEEYVENAIENSPELQWTVDRWIEMQICQDKVESTEVESIKPIVKKNVAAIQESPGIEEEREVSAIRKLRISRIVYMAASILLLIGISLPLLINSSRINPDSGMPFDFPAGERIPMEYSDLTDNPSNKNVEPIRESEEDFSYRYIIYKTAIVFMWEKRIEHAEIVLYSSNGTQLVWGTMENHSTIAFPHTHIHESDKPIWASLKFQDTDFYLVDSIMINF